MQRSSLLARVVPVGYSLMSLLGGNGLRIVLYHHFAEHDSEFTDRLGVRTQPDDFEWQLDTFARDYDVVDLDAVLNGKLPRRPLLITFDDAYRSVLDIAAPMLAARNLPSVFFLASEIVTGKGLMLDNLLNLLANRVGIGQLERTITGSEPRQVDVPDLIRNVISGLPYPVRSGLADRLTAEFDLDPAELRRRADLYLEPDQVAQLADYRVEVGNHSGSHVHCGHLDDEAAEREVSRSKAELEDLSGRAVRAFSHPYGDPGSESVERAILEAGHEAEFLVYARAMSRRHVGPSWYRTSIQARHPRQLFAEIEVLPRLRALRSRLA